MTIKYAIRRERTAPVMPEERVVFKASNYSEEELDFAYEEVPKQVADSDARNGMFAVFLADGARVTEWMPNQPETAAKPPQLSAADSYWRAMKIYSIILGSPFVILGLFMALVFVVDSVTKLIP